MNILVDTSVWSLALRRKTESLNATERFLVAELSELIREGRARLVGLVRQELLSGIFGRHQRGAWTKEDPGFASAGPGSWSRERSLRSPKGEDEPKTALGD